MARTVRSKKRKAQMAEGEALDTGADSRGDAAPSLHDALIAHEPKLELNIGDGTAQTLNAIFSWASKNTPARTTIRQIYAFMMIAGASETPNPLTLSQVRFGGGVDVYGKEVFLTSIGRSYQLFLTSELSDDEMALGWVEQENDPKDKRVKYLRLTAEGKAKYAELRELLAG